MRIQWNKKYTTIAVYSLLVLIGAISFASIFNNLSVFMKILDTVYQPIRPILYGVVIAFLINPIIKFFEFRVMPMLDKKGRIGKRLRRVLGMIVAYLLSLVVVFGTIAIIIPSMIDNVQGILEKSPEYMALAQSAATSLTDMLPEDVAGEVNELLTSFSTDIVQRGYKILSSSFPTIFNYTVAFTGVIVRLIMGLIVSVYILLDKESFLANSKRLIYAFFSDKDAQWLMELGRYSNKVFNSFIVSKIADSVIVGVMCFIPLQLMGFKNVMLISIITAIFNIIPYVGPVIGAVPCFLIIVVDNPVQSVIWLVFIIILQQIDGNIIAPLLMSEGMGLSTFWVFVAIATFGSFFGLVGMFIGVPIFAVFYWIVCQLIDAKLQKKNLSTNSDDYMGIDNQEETLNS